MDSSEFRYWNNYSRKMARETLDKASIAESYWDLGNFFYRLRIQDSSYYYYREAYDYYEQIDSAYYAGRILLNMAIIQKNIKDYTGSEITTIKALKQFESIHPRDQLYMAYNNLGIVSNGMGEFSTAIKYHRKAIEQIDNKLSSTKYSSSLNNIGVVYKDSGNYSEAINYYRKALEEDSLLARNPRLYAMILDNITFSRMKNGDTLHVFNSYQEAKAIRDSINDVSGIVVNNIHLGEYYLEIVKDTEKAKKSFFSAKMLAEETGNNNDLLEALLFLVETDKKNQNKYLKNYLTLSDSLLREERAIRNKFTKIQFETDKFIEANKDLNYRNRNMLIGFSCLILILTLIYIVHNQRINNKKLLLEKQQTEANEEIYNLLLKQKTKLAEGRNQEKKRISSELHDGILSTLFGVRMTLSSLNRNQDDDSIEVREKNIDELQRMEHEIRNISHDLYSDQENTEVDLINIVEDFIYNQPSLHDKKVIVKFGQDIEWGDISPKVKINLFRIIQESIFNSIKYANCSLISILFQRESNHYMLEISDNGGGFDIEKIKKGLGIRNIYSRVKEVQGDIQLISGDQGTKYLIKIPF